MTVSAPHPYVPADGSASVRKRASKVNRLVYASALAVAVGCVGLATPMLLAGVSSIHAERALLQWEGSDTAPTLAYWDLTRSRAERANALYPVANGEYLDRLGRVHVWAGQTEPAVEDAQPSLNAAVVAFRQSTEARPAWPWTWLRLAYGKSALAELDEEFDRALHSAVATGAGRIDVNRSLAALGFGNWAGLSRDQRALILGAAGRAVSHSPEEARRIHALALAAGVERPLCWSLGRAVRTQQQICTEEG